MTCGRPVRRGFWGQYLWKGRRGTGREEDGRGGEGRERKRVAEREAKW